MKKPNTTQRSWSNYVGDKPILNWVGKAPVGEGRFYADSYLYGPGSSYVPPKAPVPALADEETDWEKLQRKSALDKAIKSMRNSTQIDRLGTSFA